MCARFIALDSFSCNIVAMIWNEQWHSKAVTVHSDNSGVEWCIRRKRCLALPRHTSHNWLFSFSFSLIL